MTPVNAAELKILCGGIISPACRVFVCVWPHGTSHHCVLFRTEAKLRVKRKEQALLSS